MIKNARLLERFEKKSLRREKLSFNKALKIFESMWAEALLVGAGKRKWSPKDIEKEIRIAKIINGI